MRRSLSYGEEDSTTGSTEEEGTGRIEGDPWAAPLAGCVGPAPPRPRGRNRCRIERFASPLLGSVGARAEETPPTRGWGLGLDPIGIRAGGGFCWANKFGVRSRGPARV